MSEPADPAGPAARPEGIGPSRLSPLVLLIDPVRMLPSLFLPLVGVLFVGGFSPSSFLWALLGVIGSVGYSALRWVTSTYQVTGYHLEITRSLIRRSSRAVPLDRIRGVDVTTPPLHRLFGLAVVRVDTGANAGDKQEGELDGVPLAEAEHLRELLLRRSRTVRRQTGHPTPAPAAPEALPPAEPEVPGTRVAPAVPEGLTPAGPATPGTRVAPAKPEGVAPVGTEAPGTWVVPAEPAAPGTPAEPGGLAAAGPAVPVAGVGPPAHEDLDVRVPARWLVYGPLSGAFLFAPFALLGGAIGLAFQWGGQFGLDESAAITLGEWLWHRPVLLVVAGVALLAAMPVAGVIMYAVFNWDFRLHRHGPSLVAERGLVTRRSVALEHGRIRGYEFAEGILERRVNVGRLWALVTGLGDSRTRGQLLPDTPRDFALRVAAQAIGPLDAALRPHPPAARRRRLFRAVAPAVAVAAAALLLGWAWIALLALVAAALGVPLGLDRYRSLGHTYDGARLSVRSGSLPRAQAVVERRAVVGWTVRQTWFQRRARVLTVIAGVGAGSGGYAAIDTGEEQGVCFAAEVTPEWITPFLHRENQPVAGAEDRLVAGREDRPAARREDLLVPEREDLPVPGQEGRPVPGGEDLSVPGQEGRPVPERKDRPAAGREDRPVPGQEECSG
ncbi:PH domain-containing protein [Sphaerisporangium fuscum]|uniref:PH domain-containing protein n=1 Tax=Sphaerisporangium fuscum TaxID=2835868 RepID=UPI002029A4D3|nr:PH domain-containing protein [Sphaerisporangium fuscum]